MKNKKSLRGLWLVIAGIILFAIRYIPSIKSEIRVGKQWYPLSEAYQLCGTLLGQFSERCGWIEPLNIVLITVSILAILAGIALLIKDR